MKRADNKVSRSTTNVGEDFTKIVNRTGTSARACGDSVVLAMWKMLCAQ